MGSGLGSATQRWTTARTGVSRPFHAEVLALGADQEFRSRICCFGGFSASLYDLICRARTEGSTGGRHIIDMPDRLLSSFLWTEWAALAQILALPFTSSGTWWERIIFKRR